MLLRLTRVVAEMKTTGSRNLSPEHRCSISQPITTGSGGCSLIPMLALCPGFAKISRKLNPTPANPRMSAVVYQESRGLQQLSGNLRCGGVGLPGASPGQPSSLRCPLLSSGPGAASSHMQSEKPGVRRWVRGPGTGSGSLGF